MRWALMSSDRPVPRRGARALVAGWFSFEEMGATAGDLLVKDVVCRWLDESGLKYDVALAHPFSGGTDWHTADPSAYSHVVFVCGPFGNGSPLTEFLPRFSGCRLIGVDLSMLQPLHQWNPFDLLLERDSSRAVRPDVAFLSEGSLTPVVGLVRAHDQTEYGSRSAHPEVNEALDRLLVPGEFAVVDIDTRLDRNATGQRTAAEVESVIARMDVVVTTRLHGLVLALKNGVPALAVDPIRGGAKIKRQAQAIGWPWCFEASVGLPELRAALRECLRQEEARRDAMRVAARARASACRRSGSLHGLRFRPRRGNDGASSTIEL